MKNIINSIIIIIVIVLSSNQKLLSQNQPPIVSNVHFSQRIDGTNIVDIYYDVLDPDGDTMTVTMKVSNNDGSTWNFNCNNVTGAIGSGITSGTNKHVVWDFVSEHPQTFGDQFKIKIIADDGATVIGIPCPGMPTVNYEGKIYHTVQIVSQCWLQENLDVGTMIPGGQYSTNNGVTEKYCYNNDPNNCNTYGGLYQWFEAMQYVTNEGTQGICPPGWHIPTLAEFQILKSAVGGDGNALKREDQGSGGGAGTNTSGFSALLAGWYIYPNYFFYLGYKAGFWSTTELSSENAYVLYLVTNDSYIGLNWSQGYCGWSVRCLKD